MLFAFIIYILNLNELLMDVVCFLINP